jgi:rubrerythrin
MTASASVEELIQVAIEAQRATEELYRRLTQLFAHVPEVARFVDRYASEKAGHAVWLNSLRGKLSAEKLAAPAIPLIYQDAQRVAESSLRDDLDQIETLEDAYKLLVETVGGEANQVLEAIVNTYYEDEKTRIYLLGHLHQHLRRVETDFPDSFNTREARQTVKAVHT